jgi:hypothetical protein
MEADGAFLPMERRDVSGQVCPTPSSRCGVSRSAGRGEGSAGVRRERRRDRDRRSQARARRTSATISRETRLAISRLDLSAQTCAVSRCGASRSAEAGRGLGRGAPRTPSRPRPPVSSAYEEGEKRDQRSRTSTSAHERARGMRTASVAAEISRRFSIRCGAPATLPVRRVE